MLWTGQVCDLSGVLARVFFSGLVNKGYILRTRASVAPTKEEPNTQRLSFIVWVPLFSLFFFLPQRKLDGSRSGDLGNQAFPVLDLSVGDTVFIGYRWFMDWFEIYIFTNVWYSNMTGRCTEFWFYVSPQLCMHVVSWIENMGGARYTYQVMDSDLNILGAVWSLLDASLAIGLQEWAQILGGFSVVTEGAWEMAEMYTVNHHETLSLQ